MISTHQFLWIIIKIFLFGLLWKSRGTFSLINYWTFWHSGFMSCFLFCYGKNCLCMLFTCYFGYRLRRSSIHAFDVYSSFAYVFFGYQSSFLCLTDFKEVVLEPIKEQFPILSYADFYQVICLLQLRLSILSYD